MPIDTLHPEYAAMAGRWKRLRDAFAGESAVKQYGGFRYQTTSGALGGAAYLPTPAGMTGEDYSAYRERAKWYGATARTAYGLTGVLMRKPPHLELPTSMEDHARDITLTGVSLQSFINQMLIDILLMGRFGVLVDFTRASAVPRPLWSGWCTENITTWLCEDAQGYQVLRAVVLLEEYYASDPGDQFLIKCHQRYRLHWLNPDGIYQVDVYQRGNQGLYQAAPSVIPERRGEPLTFLPFQFFAPMHLTPCVEKSPLEDLAGLNFANYRHSADYEHGLHLTALPTAIITGFRDEQVTLAIGSQAVWQIPTPEANVFFLEFQGKGLESHERVMETDKKEMATMGARLLEDQPLVQETLGAVRLRQGGEQSMLASWAENISEGLTQLLRWHAWWAGETDDPMDESIVLSLNTDFAPAALPAAEMVALMQIWQGGGMSLETFLWNLQQGERLPPDRDLEDEMQKIDEKPPPMALLPARAVVPRGGTSNGQRQTAQGQTAQAQAQTE